MGRECRHFGSNHFTSFFKCRPISPRHNPRKNSRSLMCFSLVHLFLFDFWPPIWAHMGHMDPHGPVYNFILLLYDLYVLFTCVYMSLGGFIHCCWMCLTFVDIVWKLILHIFNHILRIWQGSFCESSGPKIQLIMQI